MAHVSTSFSTGFSFAARIEALVAAFKEAREQRQKYNQTVRELSGMSDRDLADIGISRFDIKDIAEQHVYG